MIKSHQHFELLGKTTFVRAVVQPPFRFMADMSHEACFYYVVSGQANIMMSGEKILRNPNEGLLMECGKYINDYKATGEETDNCEAIGIHLHPEILKAVFEKDFPESLLGDKKIEPLRIETYESSALLATYISGLQFYFENPKLVDDELQKLKIKELLLLLVKIGRQESVHSLIQAVFTKSAIDFKGVIQANLYNNLSLQELAALSNLSVSSFKREFKKHFDETPARYIKQKKLERAAHLLGATELRIADIAYDCGFQDGANFSKSFKAVYGMSPNQFRSKKTPQT